MTWVYPRRKDGVYSIHYDGTQKAAQEIAELLKLKVYQETDPVTGIRPGDVGGNLIINHDKFSETVVEPGYCVVIGKNRQLLEVIEWWDFQEKYSKDGM